MPASRTLVALEVLQEAAAGTRENSEDLQRIDRLKNARMIFQVALGWDEKKENSLIGGDYTDQKLSRV